MTNMEFTGTCIQQLYPQFDPKNQNQPVGRSGHCMCSDESDFYLFGGYSPADDRNGIPQNTVLSELWKFNYASEEWIRIDTLDNPATCASSCIQVRNKQVFIFGGTGYPFGHIMSNKIKTVKLRHPKNELEKDKQECSFQNVWQLIETKHINKTALHPAYGQSLMFHKDYIYVFGGAVGYYSEAVATLHRLNIETLTWEKLHPLGRGPSGRYKQEIAEDSENFYVFGGGRLYHAESLEKIYKYNYTGNHWEELVTVPDQAYGYPKSRCSFSFAQEDIHVYISGGRHYSMETEHEALADFWHLRLDTLKWTKLKLSLPKPLYFHSSVISPGGFMFIFGGVLPDGMRSPYLYKLRLPGCIPKLLEHSWEIICRALLRNKKVNQEKLALLGIPCNLVDRVSL